MMGAANGDFAVYIHSHPTELNATTGRPTTARYFARLHHHFYDRTTAGAARELGGVNVLSLLGVI